MELSQLLVSTMLLRKKAKELGLTQLERLVLIQMSEAYPCIRKSHATIADNIGCSTKTVQRGIKRCVELGYVIVVKPFDSKTNSPAEYTLDLKKLGLEDSGKED